MSKTYTIAPESVAEMAGEIIAEHHDDLGTAHVRIDYLFARSDEGPAVTLGGYPCAAIVKINSLKDRVVGMGDAQVIIDAEHWDDLTEKQKIALLDHELHHLIVRMEDGEVERDSHGRPLLKMRKHDRQFGWFDVIARRHRENSAEVIQARNLWDKAGQAYFPFLDSTKVVSFASAAPKKGAKAK